ncbi:MAG: twin-arginine translocase subunit TatC [Burkholderiaceae bacterium]|jgi:sec-independent protein translocase protein TatC
MASPTEDELAGTEQPFVAHLVELRDRLLKSVYGVAILFAGLCAWPGPTRLYDLLSKPLIAALPAGSHMIAVGVVSPFLIPIKVTVLAAFGVALPWVLYQVWAFVAPGLYKHEKRLVMPLVVTSTVLFYTGVAFCYFVVFKDAFPAIQRMAPSSVTVSPDIEAYLDFVITMFIAFGVAFEVPVAVVIVARLGIVSVEQLRKFRNYFWVVAAGIAGLVTPPDPGSMISLMVPMILLYEVGIWVAPIFIRKTQAPDAASSSEST